MGRLASTAVRAAPGRAADHLIESDTRQSDLAYTRDGDALWFSESTTYYYDNDAAQSGHIESKPEGQETWMQATGIGPGTISFYWKVSAEYCDYLEFYIDGTLQSGRIGGETSWAQKSFSVTGSGIHTFKWRYVKSDSGFEGSDCGWVDKVEWTSATAESEAPMPTDWDQLSYTYDPAGRRIEKKYDGETLVKYVYDGAHCLAEYNGNNNLLRKYIYGPGVDQPVCMIEVTDSNALSYYHFDGLGSVIALTDEDGNTAVLYEYSVYGQVASSDPNHPNRFMFTGREFDKETGLYYYRARYYHPEIGRFLQTDPIGYKGGMNWYAYCSNNSTNRVDPSGMVGRFLNSENGALRYQGEDGTVTEFRGEDALFQWMDWYSSDLHSRGILASQLIGYKMAGEDTNLNMELLWTLQAMMALGYDEDKLRASDAKGVTIEFITDMKSQEWNKVVSWDLHGDHPLTSEDLVDVTPGINPPSFLPGMVWLAHELEHAWQDVTGQLIGYVKGNQVAAMAEEGAMMAQNAMAYAFYKKVPGYGKGEAYETKGPMAVYNWFSGISEMTGQPAPVPKFMTWDDYEKMAGFKPVY